jgi:hypothetical protein
VYANHHSEEVTFLDCASIFFDGTDRLSDERLPDALHPSATGDAVGALQMIASPGAVVHTCHVVMCAYALQCGRPADAKHCM